MNSEVLRKVLRYISFKPRTQKEIRKYLKQKLMLDGSQVEEVLGYLKEHNFIDDEYYKSVYLSSKVEKGFGYHYIKHKLRQKGIDVNQDEVSINFEKVVDIVIKRYGKKIKENKAKAINIVVGFLSYRGFKKDEISKILIEVYKKLGG